MKQLTTLELYKMTVKLNLLDDKKPQIKTRESLIRILKKHNRGLENV